jgi:hypothetical protein
MDEQKTTTKNGEPRIDADIANLKIEAGSLNWDEGNMKSGEIEVSLPNGTKVCIQASVSGDWNKCTIGIHRLNDTEITLYEKSSTITKRAQKIKGESRFTKINKKVA